MELQVGQRARRELTVDADVVRGYAEITGDYNPLHFDVISQVVRDLGGLSRRRNRHWAALRARGDGHAWGWIGLRVTEL